MDKLRLTNGIKKCGVGYGRGSPHGGAFELVPIGIAKAEDVIGHDEA